MEPQTLLGECCERKMPCGEPEPEAFEERRFPRENRHFGSQEYDRHLSLRTVNRTNGKSGRITQSRVLPSGARFLNQLGSPAALD